MIKPIITSKSPEDSEKLLNVKAVMLYTVNQGLKLLHPIMPYVTEELYQRINRVSSDSPMASIMIQPFPESSEVWDTFDALHFGYVIDGVCDVRSFLKNDKYNRVESKLMS